MKNKQNPLEKVIKQVGGQKELANRINEMVPVERQVKQPHISYWLRAGVPIKWVDIIASIAGHKVTPEQLADWKLHKQMETRFKKH